MVEWDDKKKEPTLPNTKWSRTNEMWNSLFSKRVIENDHLSTPLKHALLGTLIPTCFYYGGKRISARISVFIIQNSGSGKSIGMKIIDEVLGKIGKRSFYTTKTTDAKLTGSYDEPKQRKAQRTPGLLEDHDFVGFDEGSVLLRAGPYNETLQDVIQVALDEPGEVSRALKYGLIRYPTNTTLVTGSYPAKKMGEIVMTKGLFQRFYMVYHIFSDDEVKSIDNKFDSLCNIRMEKSDPEIEFFKTLQEGLPETLEIGLDDLKRIHEEKIIPYRDEKIFQQYGDSKGEVLVSFWFRMRIKMLKFALHYAVLNNKQKIDHESLEYGFELLKEEVKYVKKIIEETVIEEQVHKINREEIVKSVLKSPLGRPVLLEKLRQYLNWGLGFNRTLELLEEFEEKKIIRVDRTQRPNIYDLFI